MGIFIEVQIDAESLSHDISEHLVRICPVDIFSITDSRLVVRAEQEDECTLCALCLRAAPAGSLRIVKKYADEVLVSDG
jgi:NAD-dependent dihydropyrimidine dehydrogenase PreA subunit